MRGSGLAGALARGAAKQPSKSSALRLPPATSSIVPTRIRTMWRMKASASIQSSSTSPGNGSANPRVRHPALITSRSKRVCPVWVGVKAVKSCLPTSAAAHRSSSVRGRPPAATRLHARSRAGAAPERPAPGSNRCASAHRGERRTPRSGGRLDDRDLPRAGPHSGGGAAHRAALPPARSSPPVPRHERPASVRPATLGIRIHRGSSRAPPRSRSVPCAASAAPPSRRTAFRRRRW